MIDLFGDNVINNKSLTNTFIIYPTTVLNRREGKWQNRKKYWINKGIKSEIGRQTSFNTNYGSDTTNWSQSSLEINNKINSISNCISIFDPVLCEIIYKWFCIDNGLILDPFAGGSVRGIVANYLGYKYTGIDIRQEQIDSNREQALKILPINNQPQWYVGDSNILLDNKFNHEFDLIFSCPPYMNLEVYSDLPNDISNLSDDDFIIQYSSIISKSCGLLKGNGYAVFVVGDIRDNKGFYKDFIGITKNIFFKCGMKLYNEIILIDPIGSKALTMNNGFKTKKLAKVHQNVLVFKKE